MKAPETVAINATFDTGGWCQAEPCLQYVGELGGYVDSLCGRCGLRVCRLHARWIDGVRLCLDCKGGC